MQRFKRTDFDDRYGLQAERFDVVANLVQPTVSGPWLVGGCVRRHLVQMPQDSDFDIAFSSPSQLACLQTELLGAGLKVTREAEAHVTLTGKIGDSKHDFVIQLLRMAYLSTVAEHLDTFDFTICQFGYDGTDYTCGDYSLWDLGRKRLALHKLTFGASTVRRLVKYSRQGFTFCQGTIVSILEATIEKPETVHAEVTYVD